MTTLLCLIVLITSIIGFFSQEFIRLFKRVWAIPGAKLVVPLLIASLIAEWFALWGWKSLFSFQTGLSFVEHGLANLLPVQTGALMVTRVVLLVLIPGIPVWVTWFMTRKKKISNALFWVYRFSAWMWAITVILLISLGG